MGFHANPRAHHPRAIIGSIADHELLVLSYPQPIGERQYQQFAGSPTRGDEGEVARLGVRSGHSTGGAVTLWRSASRSRGFVIALNLSDFLLSGGYLGAVVQQGVG